MVLSAGRVAPTPISHARMWFIGPPAKGVFPFGGIGFLAPRESQSMRCGMQISGQEMAIPKALAVSARGAFLFVLLCGFALLLLPGESREEQTAQSGLIVVAPGNSGAQAQPGGGKIIAAKLPPRSVDDHFRALVRTNLTDKSVPVVTMVLVGEDQDERTDFADKIENFLRADGYIVKPRRYFPAGGGPVLKGILIDSKSNPATIKIGANAADVQ